MVDRSAAQHAHDGASRVIAIEVLQPQRRKQWLQAPLNRAVPERLLRPLQDVRGGWRRDRGGHAVADQLVEKRVVREVLS